MTRTSRLWAVLLGVLLFACASTPSVVPEQAAVRHEHEHQHECDAPSADRCVTVLCAGERCGVFRCEAAETGRVVRTFSGAQLAPLPPMAANSPMRYWGCAQGLPGDSLPVFEIPWNPRPLMPKQKTRLQKMAEEWAKLPKEKHHLFPQEKGLKEWFERQGVDIHQDTLVLDVETHHRIHRGERGGPWNEAWRKFQRAHFLATKQEMYRYAWELVVRFDLLGPFVPYDVLLELPAED
jgi:uncharacterized lipoprotein (TIGR02269 family)